MKENTEKTVIKADTRFIQLLISAAAMADIKSDTRSEDCVHIAYSKEENQLIVDTVNVYGFASHIVACAQMGITVETGDADRPGGVLIKAEQILKYFKKFTRPARGIVELEIDWEQGCYTLTGDAGIVTYKTCEDCLSDRGEFVEKILNVDYAAKPVTEFMLDQGLLGKVIKSIGLTPWVKETGSTALHALEFAFGSRITGLVRISPQSADGIIYRYMIMGMRKPKAASKTRKKKADCSGDTAPKDTAPVKDTPQDTKPADHSGDTARTVKDTNKTPEKTAAEKKTAVTADRLAEKIGAVRSVTPKMRDRLITAVKRGDEIEKALLYAFGSLKGWRVGECRKIIAANAM